MNRPRPNNSAIGSREGSGPAYVLSTGEHWATFLTPVDLFGLELIDDAVLELFDEPLLVFGFAEDHSLSIQVFDEGDLVVDYELAWDCDSGPDAIEVRCDSDDIALLHALGRKRGSKLWRRQLSVHAVAPALHRAVRPLAKWIRGGEPKALALADRLLPPPASPSREAAAWPPFVFPPGDPLAILPGEWLALGENDRGRARRQDSAA